MCLCVLYAFMCILYTLTYMHILYYLHTSCTYIYTHIPIHAHIAFHSLHSCILRIQLGHDCELDCIYIKVYIPIKANMSKI